MSVISTRVRNELNYIFPENRTNFELAHRLDIPEPSVRRATRELRRAKLIKYAGLSGSGAVLFIGLPATEARVDEAKEIA